MANPICVGDTVPFKVAPTRGGSPWDISAGTTTIYFKAPNGAVTSHATTYSGGYAWYTTTTADLNMAGTWYVSWLFVAQGLSLSTVPQSFTVSASP